ncbi:hypothetical protein ST37_01660 (plasmid) [Vibrio sp. qd031]|uniref:5-oxoprolinase subunit B family protein n=1 Tax=Vibrio sp. qd031 TaxID=1603038 RepID=UPI000A1106C8|nr:allophanate hydrolase subunit 1 [Vibrio sp. qd031]ORT52505.1 hypothetical protein ST37_01660 [Vibrio sp. qd031]
MRQPTYQQVSEHTWLIELFDDINQHAPMVIAQLVDYLEQRFTGIIVSLTPSYTTLLVEFHPAHNLSSSQLRTALESWSVNGVDSLWSIDNTNAQTVHNIPTLYDSRVAPDLHLVAIQCGVSVDHLIELHTSTDYLVHAIGFAPGFAFAAELNGAIQLPRLSTPRTVVPAGSVAIAEKQTAVYPFSSPGGWNIIGRTPKRLVDYQRDPITPFKVGDTLRFEAITQQQFKELGGRL